jgi:hypothetical protein
MYQISTYYGKLGQIYVYYVKFCKLSVCYGKLCQILAYDDKLKSRHFMAEKANCRPVIAS